TPGGENKSAAIRDYLAKNPKAKVSEIVAALAAKGTKVQPSLVYFIRSKSKAKAKKARRAKATAVASSNGMADPITVVKGIKELAGQAGGIKKLKELVDLLAE